MSTLTASAAWQALEAHQQHMAGVQLRSLFDADAQRSERFSIDACGLHLDFSKNLLSQVTLDHLIALAEQQQLPNWRDAMFAGKTVNQTEGRAVLHTALRAPANAQVFVGNENVIPGVHRVLEQMESFTQRVQNGQWRGYTNKPLTHIINIGIGGSDLGPKMVTTALKSYAVPGFKVDYVSNIDAAHLDDVLLDVDPETCLFIIASKTFTTQETMTNARTARQWFVSKSGDEAHVAKHFVAVSTNLHATQAFGIDDEQVFEFWDWVGGRYSLWSAIGLSIALYLGMDHFRALLAGAHQMDQHFIDAPLHQNMPVIMAMVGVWYNNFLSINQQLILPYNYPLRHFPAFIQQLDMESNGKQIDRDNQPVDYATGPAIWGDLGSNAQHAFYQLVHQGTHVMPSDLILAARTHVNDKTHQTGLAANYIAQTEALMNGKSSSAVRDEMGEQVDEAIVPHKVFPGNRPSNSVVMEVLDPRCLGALIALYEHKVFVQGIVWNINSYDQWGVELGKQLAKGLIPSLEAGKTSGSHDASTAALVSRIAPTL